MANGDVVVTRPDPEVTTSSVPPPPPDLSDEQEAKLERIERREQTKKQLELEEQSFGEERELAALRAKELAPAYAALNREALNVEQTSRGATRRLLSQQRDVPEMKQPDIRADAGAWMMAATLLGSLAGARSRQGATAALNAFAGAMQGWAKGDLAGFERNYKVWQANAERTYEMNARAQREYEAVMKDARLDFDTKANMIKMIAAKWDDQLMIPQAEQRHIERMTQLMDAKARANDNYYFHMQSLQQHHDDTILKAKAQVARYGMKLNTDADGNISIDLDTSTGSPIWARAKAIADYKQALCSSVANPTCTQLMGLVQQLNPDYNATKWTGQQAYARTAGTYGARVESATNEVAYFIPQALAASNQVPRGSWVPLNQLIQGGKVVTSDPKYFDFATANISLLQAYARAVNPTGVPRIATQDHMEKLLSTAVSPEAYQAVLSRIAKEVKASHAAIAMTRGEN